MTLHEFILLTKMLKKENISNKNIKIYAPDHTLLSIESSEILILSEETIKTFDEFVLEDIKEDLAPVRPPIAIISRRKDVIRLIALHDIAVIRVSDY